MDIAFEDNTSIVDYGWAAEEIVGSSINLNSGDFELHSKQPTDSFSINEENTAALTDGREKYYLVYEGSSGFSKIPETSTKPEDNILGIFFYYEGTHSGSEVTIPPIAQETTNNNNSNLSEIIINNIDKLINDNTKINNNYGKITINTNNINNAFQYKVIDYQEKRIIKKFDYNRKMARCTICGKWLKDKPALDSHNRFKHIPCIENNQCCNICEKRFNTKSALAIHRHHKHMPSKKTHQCLECLKRFCTQHGLRTHKFIKHRPLISRRLRRLEPKNNVLTVQPELVILR